MSEWTDSEGESLGDWVVIDRDEYWRLYGTGKDLEVFASLTDSDGHYGPPQIYTAWGYRGEEAPFIDIRDYKGEDGRVERQVCRRFAARVSVESEGKNNG